jgi:hypothetical protein
METVFVRRVLRAPIDRVFDVLSDHAGYVAFPGVRRASLLTRGAGDEPNGVGAVREIDAGLSLLREEITAFQRPTRMEYVIVSSRPPMRHRGGTVVLREADGGTLVEWTSTFAVDLPVGAALASKLAARVMSRVFHTVLTATEQRARA